MATRLYLATRRATSSWSVSGVTLTGSSCRSSPTGAAGSAVTRRRQGRLPTRWSWFVHHVEDRGGLGHRGLADLLHRLSHRDVLQDGEHVGGHQPPGRLLAVLEEPLDLLGLLLLHEVQHLLDLLGGQLLQDLGGVVRSHPIEDARDLALVERGGQL